MAITYTDVTLDFTYILRDYDAGTYPDLQDAEDYINNALGTSITLTELQSASPGFERQVSNGGTPLFNLGLYQGYSNNMRAVGAALPASDPRTNMISAFTSGDYTLPTAVTFRVYSNGIIAIPITAYSYTQIYTICGSTGLYYFVNLNNNTTFGIYGNGSLACKYYNGNTQTIVNLIPTAQSRTVTSPNTIKKGLVYDENGDLYEPLVALTQMIESPTPSDEVINYWNGEEVKQIYILPNGTSTSMLHGFEVE